MSSVKALGPKGITAECSHYSKKCALINQASSVPNLISNGQNVKWTNFKMQ